MRSLRRHAVVNVRGRVGILTVLLIVVLALQAVVAQAAAGLCSDTDTVSNFDLVGVVLANPLRLANNLVAYDDGIVRWSPTGP